MRANFSCLLVLASVAYAGQSLSNTSSAVSNSGYALTKTTTLRAEMYFHDWPSSPAAQTGFPCLNPGLGFYCQFTANNYLNINPYWDTNGGVFQIDLSKITNGHLALYIRYQHDPTGLTETCEAWDTDGNRIYFKTNAIVLNSYTGTGVQVGGGATGVGFFRAESTLIAANSRVPLTSDNTNVFFHWKFDGNLNDASGNNIVPTGTPTYTATPWQNVIAIAKTYGAPTWSNAVPLRAGKPNKLDGSQSYSQGDNPAALTYAWTQTSGPYTLTFDDATLAQPTVTGLIFGLYGFHLVVTDSSLSTSATADISVGAVATDNNGVVVNANPIVDQLFGPAIAFGQNPWGYADYYVSTTSDNRYQEYIGNIALPGGHTYNLTSTYPYSTWEATYPGTVSYTWNGIGMNWSSATGTTLSAAINTTADTSFTVADISKIDTSGLPGTPIRVYLYYSDPSLGDRWEEIRVCSVSGNTLTTCASGRGTTATGLPKLAARTWAIGTPVGQFRLNGVGTQFTSTICANSPNRSTFLHFTRPDGGDSYVSFNAAAGCESDTAAYLFPYYDPSPYGLSYGNVQTGKGYGYMDNETDWYNQGSYGGINFYCEDCAHRILYYRTGDPKYKTRANMIGDIWAKYGGGVMHGAPLESGGFIIGGFIDAALSDSGHKLNFADLRRYAYQGVQVVQVMPPVATPGTCNPYDSRDSGYLMAALSLAALLDTDNVNISSFDGSKTWAAYWQYWLGQMYLAENACKQSDNSWSNTGYRWGNTGVKVTFTNGSNIGVSANGNFPTDNSNYSAKCFGTASGTGSATAGSGTITGTGFTSGGYRIAISGTKAGQPFTMWQYYTFTSSTQISFAYGATWQGDTGSVTWMIDSSAWPVSFASIALGVEDSALNHSFSCQWVDSTHLKLMRNWSTSWDGSASATYGLYTYNAAGRAQQPYQLGIRQTNWKWAANAALNAGNSTLATNFDNLRKLAGQWIHDTGYSSLTGGMFYTRVEEMCEPITAASMGNEVCYSGNPPNGAYSLTASRELNAECSSCLWSYKDTGAGDGVTFGDTAYGNLWGVNGYNLEGAYNNSDQNNEASANAMGSNWVVGKMLGFFGGMGMAHQWPALRLGGVAAAQPTATTVAFSLSSHPGSDHVVLSWVEPSSKTGATTCFTSPCSVNLDARQGTHWAQVAFYSAANSLLATDSAFMLTPGASSGTGGSTQPPATQPSTKLAGKVRLSGKSSVR